MTALRLLLILLFPLSVVAEPAGSPLWWRDNLDAWCIVPFDAKQRTPAQRAEMVVKLGLKKVAYDWREKHVPEFEEEILQYQKHGIEFFAFWDVHPKAFELFAKYKLHPQVWLMAPNPQAATNGEKIKLAAEGLLPAVEQTRKIGSKLALYNHGGWNGEPENLTGIVEYLRKHHNGGHVGIVYNFHHGHAHIETFAAKWKLMQPYLLAVNLNGMEAGGDAKGRKILHLGEGDRELEMMRIIEQSGWRGPVGIIDHREDTDSEVTLRNNLLGLDWLRKELVNPGSGGPRPVYAAAAKPAAGAAELVEGLFGKALNAARGGLLVAGNDAWRTAPFTVEAWVKLRTSTGFNIAVASDTKASPRHWEMYSYAGAGDFAVFLPGQGGEVRTGVKICDNAWHHLAMVLEPQRIRLYVDGKPVQEKALPAVTAAAVPGELGIGRTVEPGIGCDGLVDDVRISRGLREIKMPEAALTRDEITLELFSGEELPKTTAAELPEREPLVPAAHPLHTHPVNRDRIYDFYAKQARDWRSNPRALLPQYPGLDGGTQGHWGNQNEDYWRDGRWNQMDCGPCMAGVFHGGGLTIPKAVCVKLGGNGERAACYDPVADAWRVVWQGGFVKFTDTRHGLMDGVLMNGEVIEDELTKQVPRKDEALRYRGYYRHGMRTVFSFDRRGEESLMSASFSGGKVQRESGEALRQFTKGGPAQWPQVLETAGTAGQPVPGWPYVVDTLTLPFENPWNTLFFIGGHDFFSNGDIALCTMTGDVWRVSGVSASLAKLRWKRMAAGLHQPLGLVVIGDKVCVMGRDQLTRLHDLNGDGEADFYECLHNNFTTPTGGHDYICGLERDAAGNFYTASGKDGLLRLKPGEKPEVLASGFRNPDGLGLSPDGILTVPYSEGDWTPASAVAQITKGGYYGYPGPRAGVKTLPPLLYLPRGVDNSSGGQTWVPDDRWGPLKGQMIHFSFGAGTHHLVLRQEVNGVWQGAAVSLPGDFNAGVHRGRFSPHDGQLYVSGMTGWGTYTPDDGCLQRVRYTGGPLHVPVAFAAHDNGVLLTFSEALDAGATATARHFAQCWNYRYGQSYGSQEYSLRQPDTAGHDVLAITSAHLLDNGCQLFLEIPQLQPAGQIHLVVQPQPGVSRELFLTAHQLAAPFTGFSGYHAIAKLPSGSAGAAATTEPLPVKWEQGAPGRSLTLRTAAGMQFEQKELRAKAGERLSLTLENPDPLPHNWVLLQPGSIERVGELSNQLVTAPDAAARHYVPDSPDILCHTRLLNATQSTTVHFTAPATPGRYPYLCTFPGHWMLMRGELLVE